jgi:hypothetical protein
MPKPQPGYWHCFACNTDTQLEYVVCGNCHRPRPRDVEAPPASSATPVDVLRAIETQREADEWNERAHFADAAVPPDAPAPDPPPPAAPARDPAPRREGPDHTSRRRAREEGSS